MITKDTDLQQQQGTERSQAMILLESMKRQQAGLEAQVESLLEQLTMTKGAVQILEKLLQDLDPQTEGQPNGNS